MLRMTANGNPWVFGDLTNAAYRKPVAPFRFRLRTLLLLMLVTGALIGLFTNQRDRALRQANRVAFLEAGGAIVGYNYRLNPFAEDSGYRDGDTSPFPRALVDALGRDFFHTADRLELRWTPDFQKVEKSFFRKAMTDRGGWKRIALGNQSFDAHDLELIGQQQGCEVLHFDSVKFESVELSALANLQEIEVLSFENLQMPDCDLRWLRTLPRLEALHIDSELTSRQLEAIGRLDRLRSLRLRRCDLRRHGYAWLNGMSSLQGLSLYECKAEDQVFAHLQEHPRLQYLRLQNNNITGRIPLGIALPQSVIDVMIADNPLETCAWVERLPALKSLDASNTCLSRDELRSVNWPESFGYLKIREIPMDSETEMQITRSRSIFVDWDR